MQTHLLMHLQYSSSVRKDRPPIKASIGLPGPVMKMIMAPTPRVTRPGATWGDKGTAAEGWSDLPFFAIFQNENFAADQFFFYESNSKKSGLRAAKF